jgi:uncharacterized integral membrane protein (TIGR00697 family)
MAWIRFSDYYIFFSFNYISVIRTHRLICMDHFFHRCGEFAGCENGGTVRFNGNARERHVRLVIFSNDVLSEKYGKKEAQKAVWLGFFTLISLTIVMQLALLYKPHELDYAQQSLETIFGLLPRIAAGSLLAFIISQSLDVYLFHFIKKRFPKDSQLWIRNNASIKTSQLVDTLIFTSVAFLDVFPMNE